MVPNSECLRSSKSIALHPQQQRPELRSFGWVSRSSAGSGDERMCRSWRLGFGAGGHVGGKDGGSVAFRGAVQWRSWPTEDAGRGICCVRRARAVRVGPPEDAGRVRRPRTARAPGPPVGVCRVPVPPEVITVAVRWYLRYGLSYRDVEELRHRVPVGAAVHPAVRRRRPPAPARHRRSVVRR